MTAPATAGAPADETYSALCLRHAALLKEAGAFLATSLRTTRPGSALRLAEEFATEANEVADKMKAWRLANGWEK